MLEESKRVVASDIGERPTVSVSELVEQLNGFIRRQFAIFILICGCTVGLGLVYLSRRNRNIRHTRLY